MGFRTLEISSAAELHIREGQLEITTEEGCILVPIEDLSLLKAPMQFLCRDNRYPLNKMNHFCKLNN